MSEFNKRMEKISDATKATFTEIMRLVGYAGDSAYYGWRKNDKVPMLCVNAMDGVIAGLGIDRPSIEPPPAQVVSPFDVDQLITILNLAMGNHVAEEDIPDIIRATVAEMSRRVTK